MVMNEKYYEPEKSVTYEEKIKRSVFIADVGICHDEEEAKSFLASIISKHRDATHNCRAYLLSSGAEYFSDDGEPSGTAGRPILNAIKHSGLVNVIVVVTRYYGGVKLGVRGLIDAYGETAKKALELAGSVEKILTGKFHVELEYNAVKTITHLLENCGGLNLRWDYAEKVNVACEVPVNSCENLEGQLEEMRERKIITNWEKLSS